MCGFRPCVAGQWPGQMHKNIFCPKLPSCLQGLSSMSENCSVQVLPLSRRDARWACIFPPPPVWGRRKDRLSALATRIALCDVTNVTLLLIVRPWRRAILGQLQGNSWTWPGHGGQFWTENIAILDRKYSYFDSFTVSRPPYCTTTLLSLTTQTMSDRTSDGQFGWLGLLQRFQLWSLISLIWL